MDTIRALDDLRAFRAEAYACFRRRADALVDVKNASGWRRTVAPVQRRRCKRRRVRVAIDATAQTRVLAAELKALRPIPYLVELNYWAGVGTNASGGQTQIFAGTTGTWSSRTAAQVLRTFFISANHWLAQGGS